VRYETYLDRLCAVEQRYEKRIEQLEAEVHQVIGWMYAYACTCVDEGVDIRTIDLPEIAEECLPTVRKAREGK
jgi:hypothetical protein